MSCPPPLILPFFFLQNVGANFPAENMSADDSLLTKCVLGAQYVKGNPHGVNYYQQGSHVAL
jgi:hypothetical protein